MSKTTYVLVFLILIAIIAPLTVPVLMSFSDTPFATFPPQGFTMRWYLKVLTHPEIQSSLLVSVRLASVSAIAALLLGVPCALGLVRYRLPGRGLVLGLVLSPLIVPLLVTGLSLLQFFSLMGSRWTFLQLAIGHTVICIPYVVRNVSSSLVLADPDIEAAARVMGANRWTTFRRVTLHQIQPGIAAGAIFAFIISFDDFPISMWLADARQFPLPLFLEVAIQRFFDPSVAALSTLMIIFALFIITVMEAVLGIRVRRFTG